MILKNQGRSPKICLIPIIYQKEPNRCATILMPYNICFRHLFEWYIVQCLPYSKLGSLIFNLENWMLSRRNFCRGKNHASSWLNIPEFNIGTRNLTMSHREKGIKWDKLTVRNGLSFWLISWFEPSFDMLRTLIGYAINPQLEIKS